MKKRFKGCISIAAAIILTVGAVGCSSKKTLPPLSTEFFQPAENPYTLAAQPSEKLLLTGESAAAVLELVSQPTQYPCEDMYSPEEIMDRLDFDATVQQHRYSIPYDQPEALLQRVSANNREFMENNTFGYELLQEQELQEICAFITQILEKARKQYPDIDWARVSCNLARLKILNKTGMLSYAQVNEEMILSVSKNSASIANTLDGENAYSRVLVHEIMHILQLGCSCEQIENCVRRAGICVYYSDSQYNLEDWTWLVEGSAERHMCKLTGTGAISYQYKMDYLCSMQLSVLLRDEVAADTVEKLCFYDEAQMLYDAFGCRDAQSAQELTRLMVTMQILQMQPNSFMLAYGEKIGIDLQNDEEALNNFCYSLKPAICITLAKEFYENLVAYTQSNAPTANDVLFMMDLFEGHLNQHLQYSSEAKLEYNRSFLEFYCQLRQSFLDALQKDNPQLDIMQLHQSYRILADGQYQLNGALADLSQDKREFLQERAQWQAEQNGLGVRVPEPDQVAS